MPAKTTKSAPTTLNPLAPSPRLLCKLGSIIVHADEYLGPNGHHFDVTTMRALLNGPEVKLWLTVLCGKPDMTPYTYERAEILEVNAARYVKRAICLDWDDIIGRDTEDMQGVTDWNDEDGRDAAQVLAVLARARKLLLGCPHEGH